MNQTTQDAPEPNGPSTNSPEVSDPPAARVHPRFTKPQRVAFVQSAWHREVIEQCRLAFLGEIEERGIERARIDLFEVPGSFEIPQQFHETAAHFDFFRKHFATKGVEVAEACANTLLSLERLRGQVAAGIV